MEGRKGLSYSTWIVITILAIIVACPAATCVGCMVLGKVGNDAAVAAMAEEERRTREEADRARAAEAVRQQALRREAVARIEHARASLITATERERARAYADAEAALQGARDQVAPLRSLVPPVDGVAAVTSEIDAVEARILPFRQALAALSAARRALAPGRTFADAIAEDDEYTSALGGLNGISGPPAREFSAELRTLRGSLQQAQRSAHREAEALRRQRQRQARQAEAEAVRVAAAAAVCGDTAPLVGTNTAAYYFRTVANDPDSVEVETCRAPRLAPGHCWLVVCDVRARNSFGGMVRRPVEFEVGRGGRLINIRQL